MTTNNNFHSLFEHLETTSSIRGALFRLQSKFGELHGCDLAYEYMMKDTSFVRGDLVSMTTLSRRFTDLYFPGGGPNSDPVLEHVTADSDPFRVSLRKLCAGKQTKFYGNKFYTALLENGCENFTSFPFKDDMGIGFGVFTIFATSDFLDQKVKDEYYRELALNFHKCMKSGGQLARYFNILDREHHALSKMADGKTAADIAQDLDVTPRSIELRLQSVRKKLQARTTTEAVYKAVAYSILP
ncbi:MAG: helix-turn-helix transcriptional regulator [Hyphomonadaceae bacterium]|nr:helix-turn-helix transcriptional regulator [Hyphomonadaceae bacterium]